MKVKKLEIWELLQLTYNQIVSELSDVERYTYEKEVKKLYKLCKKPILKKIKERFIKCLIIIKKLLKRIKK